MKKLLGSTTLAKIINILKTLWAFYDFARSSWIIQFYKALHILISINAASSKKKNYVMPCRSEIIKAINRYFVPIIKFCVSLAISCSYYFKLSSQISLRKMQKERVSFNSIDMCINNLFYRWKTRWIQSWPRAMKGINHWTTTSFT